MKAVQRGGELPPDFDLRKSAIYNNNSSSVPREDLYRNQSRSQFEYAETYKSSSSKPLTADNSSSYVPTKPYSNYSSYNYGGYNISY